MKEAVTKLAERLKNVLAVKRRTARRGKFDVKDTLRKNPSSTAASRSRSGSTGGSG
jgi:hypothetical protein